MIKIFIELINTLKSIAEQTTDESTRQQVLALMTMMQDNISVANSSELDGITLNKENEFSTFLCGINTYITKVIKMDSIIIASSAEDCALKNKNLLVGGMPAKKIMDHMIVLLNELPDFAQIILRSLAIKKSFFNEPQSPK